MGNSVSHCEEAAVEAPVEVEEVPLSDAMPIANVQEVVEEEPVAEEEPEEEPKREIVISTTPHDFRFPVTNQARHCFVKYNEAHKCFAEKGAENEECARRASAYRSICPTEWLDKWNEAREAGAWWGKY